jgi:transcriptional regulator with XRE-family HTH domain
MIWSPDRSAVAVSSFSSNLSPAQVFGRQLAAWRNRAGLTQEKVAREASISLSYFRKIESGDRTPTEHLAKVADDLCEADGILMALFEQLSSSFREQTFPGWFGEWVDDVEAAAVTLRTYEPLLAPGLLQVESYAMAILSTRIGDSRDEIDEMVSARMARQQILEREKPPALWAILDEGVFRRCRRAGHHEASMPPPARDGLTHRYRDPRNPAVYRSARGAVRGVRHRGSPRG